jgi:hypothetical protein
MSDYKKVVILENEVEARLVESVLKERDIPHILKSYYDTAYDGLFQSQKGWGHVEAPDEYEEEIKAIYRDISQKDDR